MFAVRDSECFFNPFGYFFYLVSALTWMVGLRKGSFKCQRPALDKNLISKKGVCDLEITKYRNKVKVILTETADNWGTSITDAFETAATQIYDQFLSDFQVHEVTWIEHYNQDSYEQGGDDSETFTRVLLSWNSKTRNFHNPQWRPYLEEWEERAQARFNQLAVSPLW